MKQTSKQPNQDSEYPHFDYRGLKCPLPVLKARRALNAYQSGDGIRILADDPAAPLDMKHFCDTEGHQLAACDEVDGYFSFMIIKGASEKAQISLTAIGVARMVSLCLIPLPLCFLRGVCIN